MGCSSSCVRITSQNKNIFISVKEKQRDEQSYLTKFRIPAIRILRPSTEIRISVVENQNRDESLLWEYWQPKESRLHSEHRCSIPNCSLNHFGNDFEKHPEEDVFSIDFWSRKLTFIDKHREISREIQNWDFLDAHDNGSEVE